MEILLEITCAAYFFSYSLWCYRATWRKGRGTFISLLCSFVLLSISIAFFFHHVILLVPKYFHLG